MTIEKWFPFVQLPISREKFRQLPQHPTYRYEYIDGVAWLTARPECYHALLTLQRRDPPDWVGGFGRETVTFRPLQESDWARLVGLFAEAFHQTPPFSLISDDERKAAARECLEKTRAGGDGPLIDAACFVARCDTADGERLLGAILVTLTQEGDLERFDDLEWTREAPPDAVERGWGRPHLTWIFTNAWNSRRGMGSALLQYAANALLEIGYRELASTFLLGNESSTLWHWRNGFRLLSCPGSPRAMDRAIERGTRETRATDRVELS